jgi:hypothetical protein
MIAEALFGIAAGSLLAGGLAGLRSIRNWRLIARIIWIGSLILTLAALAVVLSGATSAIPARIAIAVAFIIAGGTFFSVRANAHAETLPLTLVGGAGALICVTLNSGSGSASPPSIEWAIVVLAGGLALPTLDGALHEWRRKTPGIDLSSAWWIGVSTAVAAHVMTSMSQHGTWMDQTPGAAWLMAAWITASGSRLTRHGEPRAALLIISVLALTASALSTP